jgi:hypothetical protein
MSLPYISSGTLNRRALFCASASKVDRENLCSRLQFVRSVKQHYNNSQMAGSCRLLAAGALDAPVLVLSVPSRAKMKAEDFLWRG